MILRDYQRRAVDAVLCATSAGRRPVLVAPTGSGKSVMASAVAAASGRVLWIAHRRELITQGAEHLRAAGLRVGVILAGVRPDASAPVQVASVQTLTRRDMPTVDLIIADEAHHCTGASYADLFTAGVPVAGFTATPWRLDGRGLSEFFTEIITAATTRELCEAGTLHAPRVFAPGSPDMRGVRKIAGEFSQGATEARAMEPKLIGDIVTHWKKHADGLKTVAFAVGIAHSRAIQQAFLDAGVNAEHIDGSTPTVERDAVLARLRGGACTVLCNCMILTEGWDMPALECAVVARPTASHCLHLQMIGRIMRASPGKSGAIVLDHAGNHHRHGPVTRGLAYTLDGVDTEKSEPLDLKHCPECFAMCSAGATACPECGYVFGADAAELPEHEAGELVEYDEKSHDYRAAFWREVEEQRVAAGYKEGYSAWKFKERFGDWPTLIGRELLDPRGATMESKRAFFAELEKTRISKGFAPGWSAHRYRAAYGVWPRGVKM